MEHWGNCVFLSRCEHRTSVGSGNTGKIIAIERAAYPPDTLNGPQSFITKNIHYSSPGTPILYSMCTLSSPPLRPRDGLLPHIDASASPRLHRVPVCLSSVAPLLCYPFSIFIVI